MTAQPLSAAFEDAQPLTYTPAGRIDADALVRRYLPLVRKLAWHVHGSMSTLIDVEDLIQVGLVALVEASAQAADQGAQFRAYLVTRLRGSMIDELRRQATTTRGAMRRHRHYKEAVASLTQQTGRPPEEAMIAAHLGVSIDKLRTDYLAADAIRFDSIDEVYADDLPWFADDAPGAFDQLAEGELRDRLIAAIGGLPEREALVVQLYYVEELNLEEIGEVIGVGAARVCQIKAAAHARLKKALA
ncbi:FliA/WhiG family RNA polymerase sigma factor [Sphingomonas sp.]|uniref:FliA/WhiG family RNA polymerase sigma factor n=1 Tax=Sphingomonas sp. TaxID=28214 RepID=UPI003CC63F02